MDPLLIWYDVSIEIKVLLLNLLEMSAILRIHMNIRISLLDSL